MEESKLIYWIILVSFIMPLLIGSFLVWFILKYQQKKQANELAQKNFLLRQQALIIEKQQAVEKERTRIASEMHDDLGSGLTTIQYLSERALKNSRDQTEQDKIKKISAYSRQLVSNMSEIIWAMNSRFDNSGDLVAYIRRYAKEYLEQREISLEFDAQKLSKEIAIGGEKRRNIFLVVKELLHNSAKYSGTDKMKITFATRDNQLLIVIREDNGIGFNRNSIQEGNGLYNIDQRLKTIDSKIDYRKTPQGMIYDISCNLVSNPANEG